MTADDDPVDALVLEYLRATEAGERPDLEGLADRLAKPEQRTELRQLVETATWARASFPAPFRPQLLVAARYRLLEHLGTGGFGKVWRAHDEKLQRDVALKLFHPLLDAEAVEATLARERRALAAVHHDGIVRLFDSGRHDDTQFLAMELVPGVPLDRVVTTLAATAYPPSRTAVEAALGGRAVAGETALIDDDWQRTSARIIASVLWALAAAHAHGIVHRDLKPGNVLLRAGGRPVVLDFGLAGLGDRDGALTERLFGTAAYLAPEQLERERMGKQVQTDVYQCGLLLYELLTLRRAFDDDARGNLLSAVRTGSFLAPRRVRPGIAAELEDVCLRALERDPTRRYPTADAFRNDLERWLAGELPAASRLGTVGRALRTGRQFSRRHRAAVLASAALLIGSVATGLLMWRSPNVEVLAAEGDRITVELRAPGLVTLWEVRLGVGNESGAPLPIVRDGINRAFAVMLPAGRQVVQVVRAESPGVMGERCVVRALELPATSATGWQTFCERVHREEDRYGRTLYRGELAKVLEEEKQPGRGGPGIGDVSLDALFAK